MDYQQQFLEINFPAPLRVLDKNMTAYIPVSLADDNESLKHFDTTSSKAWVSYMSSYLKGKKGEVAYGGYLEKRNLYQRSPHFNATTVRNIHLGIDLWCEAGTQVLAVLDGEVHSFQDNNGYGDYGPTIILKHHIEGIVFYSLYGHLSVESLERLEPGQPVKQGAAIATLGAPEVNGDYAPHLHFQLILDMQGNYGDYPGVCSEKDLDYYRKNCPDPNLLLGLE